MSQELVSEFLSFIDAEVARRGIPGVVVGVLHDGAEHFGRFGVTNVDNPLPVDEDTLFQVGSITKTFTATAAMRLVEQTALDLDRPVRDYVPDLQLADANVAAGVTSRHLLTHTSGWVGDYFSDTGRGDDALARYVLEMKNLEQLTPPGTLYSYCNSGFSLLGRVIEVLTDQTFEAALKRLVLGPLGLEHSFLFPEEVMTQRYCAGHAGGPDGKQRVLRPWHLPRSATPAGGLISSCRDQLRYARFHMGDGTGINGEQVHTPATLEAMRQPLVPSTGLPERAVGLAWNIGERNIAHGGGTFGQTTYLMICPDHGVALSVLTNAGIGFEVADEAARWVLERFVGVSRPHTPAVAVAGEVLDACVGVYRGPLDDVEVGRLGETLVARPVFKGGFPTRDTPPPPWPPPVMRLGFYAEDRLVGLDPPFLETRAELIRGPDGEVAWLRFGGRIHRRV
ncbi:MAG: beta-lactamase family protein [Chloroflexota bacterium]|nr:beta-lactamase family protein [Chloroflexota bacterium]